MALLVYEMHSLLYLLCNGYFVADGFPIKQCSIRMDTNNITPYPDYLLDDVEIIEVLHNPNWEEDAMHNVEQLRKTNLVVTIKRGQRANSNIDNQNLLLTVSTFYNHYLTSY